MEREGKEIVCLPGNEARSVDTTYDGERERRLLGFSSFQRWEKERKELERRRRFSCCFREVNERKKGGKEQISRVVFSSSN